MTNPAGDNEQSLRKVSGSVIIEEHLPGREAHLVDGFGTLTTEQFCYLTTKGRKTARPHTIEIWFAAVPGSATLYMLSGGGERSDWVRNISNDPSVSVRIGSEEFRGQGRVVTGGPEDLQARKLVVAKYYGREELHSSGWEVEALPVAVDLEVQ